MWHNLEVLGTCDTFWLNPHPTMSSEIIMSIAPQVRRKEKWAFLFGHHGQAQIVNGVCFWVQKTMLSKVNLEP